MSKVFDELVDLFEDAGWKERTVGPDWSGLRFLNSDVRINYKIELIELNDSCVIRKVSNGETILEIVCKIKD